jgi:TonB family protein
LEELASASLPSNFPSNPESAENSESLIRKLDLRRTVAVAILITVIAAALGWWHWQQGWAELEAQVPAKKIVVAQPHLKLPAEVMARRVIHHALPEYPEAARQAGVQGTVVLDTIVNGEGAVTQVKFVSGPEALSQAAMDAVRGWRYEPYLMNGQPVTVESSVIVNFRIAN